MQILEELWYGNLCPIAQEGYRNTEYRELIALLSHNEEKLIPSLNREQQDNLQKIKDLWEEMESISKCSAFISGFQLAVQLMTASI